MSESTTANNQNNDAPKREFEEVKFYCIDTLLPKLIPPPGEEYTKTMVIAEEDFARIDLMNKTIQAHLTAALARCEARRQALAVYPGVLPTDA